MIPDQWASTSREFIESRESMIVNNYAQYCSVVKTGIGKARMIIGGEVDACRSEVSIPTPYSGELRREFMFTIAGASFSSSCAS